MAVTPRAAILEMDSYRPGRAPADVHGPDVPAELVRLASNESPFGPLPSVVRTIQHQIEDINRYPDARGAELRARLAEFVGLPVDHVTIGPGSVGLLWQLSQVFLDDRTDLVSPWPSFEAYPIIASLMGARFVPVALGATGAADPDALLAAIGDRTRVMVLAEPNNPTGRAVGGDAVHELASRTAGRCLLVVDEAYVDFDPGSDSTRSIELIRRHSHVVVLRTFSKAHGLAGLRVGYALGEPTVIELLDRVAPPFAVSSLAQVAAIASLDAGAEMRDRVDSVTAERDRVVEALLQRGVDVERSATNFVWIPCRDADRQAAQLERAGIITRPFAGHGLRVTIGSYHDNTRFIDAYEAVHRRLVTGGRAGSTPSH
jgi:histidinol-phosphate aminotransferase